MRERCTRFVVVIMLTMAAALPALAQESSGGDSGKIGRPGSRFAPNGLPIAANSTYFSGNYSYAYVVGGTATLKADSVSNTNATATGPLRFALWFTTGSYPGSGYIGATYQFTSSLAAGATLTNVQGTGPFTNPPTGCYYVTLALEELVGGTWTMRDYGGFSLSSDSGNGCITSFTATPSSISAGGSSTLAWTTTGTVSSVSIDQGIGSLAANGNRSVSPAATTTYKLTANNVAVNPLPSKQVTVTVAAPVTAPAITSFTASPFAISPGASSTLSWSTTNATSVSLDNGIGAVTLNGSKIVSPSVTTTYKLTATGSGGTVTRNVTVAVATGPCSDPNYVCLSNSRFAVKIEWKTSDGTKGVGTPIKYTADSGLFWFFGPDNIEVLLKVLNACSLTQSYWIFSAATTDVEYTITVLDTASGRKKTYFHAGGTPAPAITDTEGLPCSVSPLLENEPARTMTLAAPKADETWKTGLTAYNGWTTPTAAAGLCADPAYVCLSNNRFAVKIDWKTSDGKTGAGNPIKYTADSGLFWFFGPDNIEALLKVLNACSLNSRYWIFAAATTDVEYTITVTDTQTSKTKTYFHAGGTPAPAITDTDGMPCQ